MDKEYLKRQFDRVSTQYVEYPAKVKFIKPNGETNWLNINDEQFEAIKKIIMGEE